MRVEIYFKGLAFLALFVAVGYIFNGLFTKTLVEEYVVDRGINGELLFVGAGIFLTGLGVSRQLIAFLAGYVYGLSTGLELSLLTSLGGCLLAYSVGFIFSETISQWRSGKERCIDRFARHHPFYLTLLLRLSPIGSNLLVNLGAGAMRMQLKPFIAGSVIGYIPQSLVFALVGSGVSIDPFIRIGFGVLLFLACSALGFYLYKSFVIKTCQESP